MENKIYKKLFGFMALIFLMCSVTFGAILFEDDQATTITNYEEGSILGYSTPSIIFNNQSDVTENFKLTTTPLYVLLSSATLTAENISITYWDDVLSNFITKSYIIPKDDTFIIELTAQDINDATTLIMHDATGQITYGYVFMNDNERGTSTVFTPLIAGVVDLVTINITIWKSIFYLFIIVVVTAFVGGLFWIGFKIIKGTNNLNDGKGFHRLEK